MPRYAALVDVAIHLPEQVLDNEHLEQIYPGWSGERFVSKTGIYERRIAGEGEYTSTLAVKAGEALFASGAVRAEDVDFLILCTQTPDHLIPTTACLVQTQLGLSTSAGAIDLSLGCSGYPYALGVAKGLIESGQAETVLLLTSDTYSRVIHPLDRSVRTIFGDGAAASLIRAVDADRPPVGPFVYGTDGSGAEHIMLPAGGVREPRSAETSKEIPGENGSIRSRETLHMNGRRVLNFGVKIVPELVQQLCQKAGTTLDDYDLFILHQANEYMLRQIQTACGIPEDRLPITMQNCANTVSSTIPLALQSCLDDGRLKPGMRLMLVGFGAGLSWGAVDVLWRG